MTTALAALASSSASLMLIPLLPTGFIPPDDLAQTQVTIELHAGQHASSRPRASAEEVRARLMKDPDVRQVYTAIGGGATGSDPFAVGGAPESRKATLLLNLSPRGGRTSSKQQIEADLREALAPCPGIRSTVGFGGAGEKLVVGADRRRRPQRCRDQSAPVVREMRALDGLGNVTSSAALTRPELVVRPDPARAADLGVTAEAIADTLRVATAGDYEQSLAKLNLSQRQVPIVVRLPESARDDLGAARAAGGAGQRAATCRWPTSPPWRSIRARRRSTATTAAATCCIEIELNGQALGDVLAKVDQLPSLVNLPPTVRRAELGDVEGMKELFESFGLAMLIGVLLHLHRAGAAVQGLHAAGDDPGGVAAVDRRRFRGVAADRQGLLDAVADRPDHADGRRDQELDPAGRVRDRRAPRPRHEPHRRAASTPATSARGRSS